MAFKGVRSSWRRWERSNLAELESMEALGFDPRPLHCNKAEIGTRLCPKNHRAAKSAILVKTVISEPIPWRGRLGRRGLVGSRFVLERFLPDSLLVGSRFHLVLNAKLVVDLIPEIRGHHFALVK